MRLHILVEGQTEDDFAKNVLAPHLRDFGFQVVAPVIVETSREADGRKYKGGGFWKNWQKDLQKLTSQHRGNKAFFTTMFDLYGLPKDFPALQEHGNDRDTARRAKKLEVAMGKEVNDWRFIPYIQRHEFETLVLVGLDELDLLLDAEDDLVGLERLRKEIEGRAPEDINDGPETAPSKRLEQHIPSYQKRIHGPLAAGGVGLEALRHQCPGFDRWIDRLEKLGQERYS